MYYAQEAESKDISLKLRGLRRGRNPYNGLVISVVWLHSLKVFCVKRMYRGAMRFQIRCLGMV